MPIKYTYMQVQYIFNRHKCVLISKTYENQLGKLDYMASCGHTNCVKLKSFLKGNGVKCKNCAFEIPSYEHVVKKFQMQKCVVTMDEAEFIQNYKNNTCKITYNASCGHKNIVSYTCLITTI